MTTWYTAGPPLRKKASGEDWTHGSGTRFDSFFDAHGQHGSPHEDRDEEKHWNTHIGPHFTSDHDVANQFADDHGSDDGHVYHVDLKMENPKHYKSEHDMSKAAWKHAKKQGKSVGEDPKHPARYEDEIRASGDPIGIADAFKDHLIDKGHDGITYGNEHEGPKLHQCAIAFHPHQVNITHTHHVDEPCTKHEDDYWGSQKSASLDLGEFFKTAGGPLIFYPAKHGGKYHLSDPLSETARCRGTVEVNRGGEPIHVQSDQDKVHPIICKRCLDSGRAAKDEGKHTASTDLTEFFKEAMATNWDDHYDKIPHEIHRGLFAPESSGAFGAPASNEDVAHMLIHAHQEEQFGHHKDRDQLSGVHWTASEDTARGFAKEHETEHYHENVNDCDHEDHHSATPVVFHAEKPQRHEIEHDERRLGWQNVYDHDHPEQEVPIAHGKNVRIKGVSWRTHDKDSHFGEQWHRHDLDKPVTLRAHDDETPDDENEWNGDRPEGHGKVASLDSEYTINHTVMNDGEHVIDAEHHTDGYAGHAHFDPDGTLHEIEVKPEHQRKGLASAMWQKAKVLGINPQHSNVRSAEGDAWAKSVGGAVPTNVHYDSHNGHNDAHNHTFSTAFTAPGYYHPYTNEDYPEALGYAPKNRREAAMHDHTLPRANREMYRSDEQVASDKADYDKGLADWHSKVKQEAGLPDDADILEARRHWHKGMKHALTMGHLSIDEAEKKGYDGDSQQERGTTGWETDYKRVGGFQNLKANSSKYYHVSTDAESAAKEGLKTRDELGQRKGGKGLGGGSSDTVSVTDDPKLPRDIYDSLHEHHAVVSGKITPQQLHDYAKNPPVGKPFHEALVKPGSPQEKDLDRMNRGKEWDLNKGERDATDEEKTYNHSQFYKRFSALRESAGGHRDPLFMCNDPHSFAKSDPKKFGIMHLTPHPKAQGYPLHPGQQHHTGSDSGEWRMGSGSPFDVDHVERPTPRHLAEFADSNHPEHGKVAHCGRCAEDLEPEDYEPEVEKTAAIGDCHCPSCNSLGMIPPGSDCTAKTAKTRDVRDAASDAGAQTGIMVAIVPPASIIKDLAVDEGEAPKQMHLTLAFLGDSSDYKPDQVDGLHEVIEAWAEGTKKFEATTQGAGTFVKNEEDGQHVLWAAVDAPGLHRVHTDLVDYLKDQGYEPKEDHSFTPHITLAYGKHHFRFIPKIERQTWTVKEVWCCIGGIWESFRLGG